MESRRKDSSVTGTSFIHPFVCSFIHSFFQPVCHPFHISQERLALNSGNSSNRNETAIKWAVLGSRKCWRPGTKSGSSWASNFTSIYPCRIGTIKSNPGSAHPLRAAPHAAESRRKELSCGWSLRSPQPESPGLPSSPGQGMPAPEGGPKSPRGHRPLFYLWPSGTKGIMCMPLTTHVPGAVSSLLVSPSAHSRKYLHPSTETVQRHRGDL